MWGGGDINRAKRARLEKGEPGSEEEEAEGAHELQRDESEGPFKISLTAPTPAAASAAAALAGPSAPTGLGRTAVRGPGGAAAGGPLQAAASAFGDDDEAEAGPSGAGAGHKRSKMDELMQSELRAKSNAAASSTGLGRSAALPGAGGRSAALADADSGGRRLDYWLAPGIVVKVMAKELSKHGLYKQKGVVERVIDRYVGELVMVGEGLDGTVVRVDQAQLETVIPSPGGADLMLTGFNDPSPERFLNP
ncbi:DNA/RNA-binding protein KIN17 [Tetrabaena socialis]|uniref:DNA/RNA-binding protein KIN17 n=1 Tax=Tetrabaena socialis TaxID=47790 RepID=A0A2J7ZPR5_9CHLO|nr:DNA/RNA-binding protein KIN17 [Tetrabaena socialis]|eukprot:PNH02265.1 DNA/RNA-binding protein KIN17 [Tetrabaena socialis]